MKVIEPTKGRVVLSLIIENQRVSRGGIVLPDSTAKSNVLLGQVVFSGETYTKGVVVLFERFTSVEVEVEGTKLFIVKEEDILGIVKENK